MAKQVQRPFSIMGSTLKPGGNVNASNQIKQLKAGQALNLLRDMKNPADKNAVFVCWGNVPLGFLPRGLAAKVAPLMDKGQKVVARKDRTIMYGVCEIAYIPDTPEVVAPPAEPGKLTIVHPLGVAPLPPQARKLLEMPELPEGVTQEDIDTATNLPPLGDSRREQTQEVPDDEPSSDTTS